VTVLESDAGMLYAIYTPGDYSHSWDCYLYKKDSGTWAAYYITTIEASAGRITGAMWVDSGTCYAILSPVTADSIEVWTAAWDNPSSWTRRATISAAEYVTGCVVADSSLFLATTIAIRRSSDGGVSWETVLTPEHAPELFGSYTPSTHPMVVDGSGSLHVFSAWRTGTWPDDSTALYHHRSDDGGDSWHHTTLGEGLRIIIPDDPWGGRSRPHWSIGATVRDGTVLMVTSSPRTHGNLSPQVSHLFHAISPDYGRTWGSVGNTVVTGISQRAQPIFVEDVLVVLFVTTYYGDERLYCVSTTDWADTYALALSAETLIDSTDPSYYTGAAVCADSLADEGQYVAGYAHDPDWDPWEPFSGQILELVDTAMNPLISTPYTILLDVHAVRQAIGGYSFWW